ncbi:MAG TPA: hypothetical protein VKU85_14150 [bacterium]|nr:hypothetical protein [bacterium]
MPVAIAGGVIGHNTDPDAHSSEPYAGLGRVLLLGATGAALGGVVGYRVGHSADQALADGVTLSGAHKNAVRAGTVLCFTALGAAGGGIYTAANHDNGSVSDEMAIAVGAGALVGVGVVLLADDRLSPQVQADFSAGGPGLSLTWNR